MEQIHLETIIPQDKYTEYVCSKFDIQDNKLVQTTIPMMNLNELSSFKWNIGLILGNSGSGKSTILKKIGEITKPTYNNEKSVISQFENLSEEEAVNLLQSVGLSSVPLWLHKPNELSNGEKARLDLAWSIANTKDGEIILIDEFTSVVNRHSAQAMSYALQRYIRKTNKQIILASCHFDIIPWLTSDWIYNLNKQDEEQCEIERIVYEDDYALYNQLNEKEILSKEIDVL